MAFLKNLASRAYALAYKHRVKLLGAAVGAAGALYPPIAPVTTLIGVFITGSDFQLGAQLGTAIGSRARQAHETHAVGAAVREALGSTQAQEALERLKAMASEPREPAE